MMRWNCLCSILLLVTPVHFSNAGTIKVCIDHIDAGDWKDAWALGPITVPAGAVFEYAGHILGGNLQDPKDLAHETFPSGWSDATPAQASRREDEIEEDATIPPSQIGAAITLVPLVLTENHPCGLANAAVLFDPQDGWVVYPLFANLELYYEIAGVIKFGALHPGFSGASSFDQVAQLHEIHASIETTLTKKITIPHIP